MSEREKELVLSVIDAAMRTPFVDASGEQVAVIDGDDGGPSTAGQVAEQLGAPNALQRTSWEDARAAIDAMRPAVRELLFAEVERLMADRAYWGPLARVLRALRSAGQQR